MNNGSCLEFLDNEINDDDFDIYVGVFDLCYYIFFLVIVFFIIGLNGWVIFFVKIYLNFKINMNVLLSSLVFLDFLIGLLSIFLYVSCDVIRKMVICVVL